MSSVDKMRPVMERSEALNVYDGWALEDEVPYVGPHPEKDKGDKNKVYMSLVGWVDVEAHMRYQKSEDFLQNIHHMLGISEMKYTELYHVKMHKV